MSIADYYMERNNLGQSGVGMAADGDGSGFVDAGDYDLWKLHFGPSSQSSTLIANSSNVPEPGSLMLVGIATIASTFIEKLQTLGILNPISTGRTGNRKNTRCLLEASSSILSVVRVMCLLFIAENRAEMLADRHAELS